MNRNWVFAISAVIVISTVLGTAFLSAIGFAVHSDAATSSNQSSASVVIPKYEMNPTGLKFGDVTICTHNCVYPATYISFDLLVNYTSQLRSLSLSVNGVQVSQRTYSTNSSLAPYAIIYKTIVPSNLMTFTPDTNYNLTMIAKFDDTKMLSATTIAKSNP